MDKGSQVGADLVQMQEMALNQKTMKLSLAWTMQNSRVTTISILPPTRCNQLEVQPILDKDFKKH